VLTKDDVVSHHLPGPPPAGCAHPRRRTSDRHRRSPWAGLARRAAAVAGSTATALLAAFQVAPVPTASPLPTPATPPAVTATAPVVPLATRPVAMTRPARIDVAAAVAAAAPAAARTSALQKALGKIGARYRYGAAGPSAFDCSGLVMWAYRGAGKSLPHSSRAMSRIGTPVSKGALQPGDLVFFYGGPSHVAIYAGNGKVVHASTAGQPVKLANLSSMPFNSARRI
jgi:peptidoglycan DL-endopeptidase CwlO